MDKQTTTTILNLSNNLIKKIEIDAFDRYISLIDIFLFIDLSLNCNFP
jgi:hypothetical protein